jgi:hypothetical protein
VNAFACAVITVMFCLIAGPVAAQPAVATLIGRVVDQQATAVPGATILVRQVSTSTAWSATSDGEGRFTFPMLAPGRYDFEATLAAFNPWRTSLTLEVGQQRALDVVLSPATVRVDLVVTGEIDRPVSTAVDGVLSSGRIESLPLNGRNFLELAFLIPGNNPAALFDPTKTNSVLISSAGQMGRGGNVNIDGQDNNDDVVGGPLLNLPIDAVQEFQIATSRYGADIGRSASSVINVVTRSGTNAMHGTAAIFARDDAWQASPPTLDNPDEAPPFDRQQISGALGGPLRRDRLFWFASGEYRDQDGGVLVGTRDVSARTISRGFAPAPSRDRLWSFRADSGGTANRYVARYAGEWAVDTAASSIERAIGSASQRQDGTNRYNSVLASWTSASRANFVHSLSGSVSTFLNETLPLATAPQLTFPSIQDGASFRMPQETRQRRLQITDSATLVRGAHSFRFGGEVQRVDAEFTLGVFQQGRIEFTHDFATFDHNGDGVINDNDLLFSVTLRSGKPDQALSLPDADNTHIAGFIQDDWAVSNRLQLNLGVRYEIDSEVNNQSRVDELNPIVLPFVTEERQRDLNNFGPRVGFAWNATEGGLVVRGGYGLYYDRIVLQIQSLERGLDGRALPVEVRAGNVFFLDPLSGQFPRFAPNIANPFNGFVLPGAGASGINIIDPHLQNPSIHEFHVGVEQTIAGVRARADVMHNQGIHFLIGRTLGEVYNPVVGGPDRVVNIESSAKTQYDGLLLSLDRPFSKGYGFRVGYTLAKAYNYANDDQIPFLNGPVDPNDLGKEWGPTPNDRRHRLTLTGQTLVANVNISALWTISSGVPMDIMMPDAQSRIPVLQRNAGGRQFHTAAELNAYVADLNAGGGVDGVLLPLVTDSARFNDSFNSLDIRVSRPFSINRRIRVEPMLEVFNLFDVTNILGISNVNYSGYSNVLVRDSEDPTNAGYLRSSRFGQPVTTAGGVFGSGGPRAMQLAARVTF